jgi:hypothetical protein
MIENSIVKISFISIDFYCCLIFNKPLFCIVPLLIRLLTNPVAPVGMVTVCPVEMVTSSVTVGCLLHDQVAFVFQLPDTMEYIIVQGFTETSVDVRLLLHPFTVQEGK